MDGSTGLLGSPASQLRSKPVLSNPALRQYNKLAFTDSAVNLPQTNAVVLKFEPQREYPRSNRVIKHSTDKFVLDTDYPSERKSMGSSVGGDSAKSFSSDYLTRPKPSMHPEYTSLNSRSSSSYRKAQSNGRYRKVTLAKLEGLTRSYEARKENDDGSSLGSLSVSVDPLHTKSLDDLFSATYMEREGVQKQLDEENCFTSKVHTPRLLQADPEAHFKSKDLLNAMIEDVSVMSMSTLNTKGQSLGERSTGTLKEWKTMYEAENINYDSASLYAEVRYLELKAKERDSGHRPTKLKATVCADLMLKLCSATGRYAKIMEPILWELLNCVFVGFPSREGELRGGEESLKGLYGMHTYFDRHREQLELYDDIHSELEMVQQGLKMSEIVKKFQTVKMVFQTGSFYQRDCAFFLWRGELRRSQQRRSIARRRALLYRWNTWRSYLRQYKAGEMEDMGHELDRKLESLERLQVLLQSHTSPKNADSSSNSASTNRIPVGAVSAGSTPTRRDAVSRGLPTVVERGESIEALTTGSSPSAGSASLSRQASLRRIGSSRSSKDFRSEEETPNATVSELSQKASSSSFAPVAEVKANTSEKLLPRERERPVAVAKLSPWEQKKADEDRLTQRRGLLDKVNADIRNTLSSLSLPPPIDVGMSPGSGDFSKHSTPMAGAGAGAGAGGPGVQPTFPATPLMDSSSQSGGENPFTFSMKGSSKMTVDLIREAAMLTSNFTCPQKNQTTQTPDVWMTNVNEQPFATPASVVPSMGLRQQSMRAALSRQNSGLRGSPVVTSGKHGGLARNDSGGGGSGAHKEEGRVDVGGLNPPAFKLESMSACQLITYVYEAKIKDGLENHSAINFYECVSLLEYTKDLMLRRYGLKRLADKYFKGLISCVIKEGNINRRLETFGQMCGLTLEGHKASQAMNESQCSFFFHALGVMFGNNLHLLEDCMNSFEIDREIVLEVLPDLFPNIEKQNSELSRTIMFEVVDLPRNTPGSELEYKVNFDDVMALIMDYFDEEHKLNPEDDFLHVPIAPPALEVVKIAKPSSPEQMKALVALTDFVKAAPVGGAPTPKKVRVIPTQMLV